MMDTALLLVKDAQPETLLRATGDSGYRHGWAARSAPLTTTGLLQSR